MNGNNMYPMNNGDQNQMPMNNMNGNMNNNMGMPMDNGMNNMPNNQPMAQNQGMNNVPMNNGMPMNNNMGQPQPMQSQQMPAQPAVPMGQPMDQSMQPQTPPGAPMYNGMQNAGPVSAPIVQPQTGGSNNGLIIGAVFILLIVGVVLLIVLKPFDKDYSGGTSSGSSSGSSSSGSSGYSGGSSGSSSGSTTKTTYKSYTCTSNTTEQNIKFLITVDVKDTSSNSVKATIKYTLSKANGQAFTAKEKDSVSANLEATVRSSFAAYGTVSGVKSSLSGGKIIVQATLTATGITATEFISDAAEGGFTCR